MQDNLILNKEIKIKKTDSSLKIFKNELNELNNKSET